MAAKRKTKKGNGDNLSTVALPYEFSHPAHWAGLGKLFTLDAGQRLISIILKGNKSNLFPADYKQFTDPKLKNVKSHITPATDNVTIVIEHTTKKAFLAELQAACAAYDDGRLTKLWVTKAAFTHKESGDAVFKIDRKANNGDGPNGAVSALLPLQSISKRHRKKISYDTAVELTAGLPVIPCFVRGYDVAQSVEEIDCPV